MVTLLKKFIQAERMGDWPLHLQCVRDMIPFFHAAGHLAYAKYSHLYLQDMMMLGNKMSEKEFKLFTNDGYFTIRRSDKFWSGLWSDMTIEQTLMRSMKTSGGFTRGRGITEGVLAKWIDGSTVAYEVCDCVEEFSGVNSTSSEQHIDLRDSKIERDNTDAKKFVNWLKVHPPFPNQKEIMSIATGVTGDANVNCYKCFQIDSLSAQKIIGNNFEDLKLKRKDNVVSLAARLSGVKIHNTLTPVNTTLLFQRMIHCIKKEEELEECFQYELSPFPLALFDELGQIRKSKKSALYNAFDKIDQKNIDF
jgi:hypothetical protein